ncbi:unnamed protein product, partial [Bubo scandiacus]
GPCSLLPPSFYMTWGRLNPNGTRPATGQRNEAIKKAEFSQGGMDLLADGWNNETAGEKSNMRASAWSRCYCKGN